MHHTKKIDPLILNSPYEEPTEYWRYLPETQNFERVKERRPAGYWRASVNRRQHKNREDPGEYKLLPLVNEIRQRVKVWREKGYVGVTSTTRALLKHWHNNRKNRHKEKHLFWCQLEAIETVIWLTEASPAARQGLDIPQDNTQWERQCIKLATGTGKTVVMAMVIAWQALNKIAYPRDIRFSKYILVIAPGITVRDRLQVLLPFSEKEKNIYDEFDLLPPENLQTLQLAKIKITNWHTLAPETEDTTSVVKKGPESDRAFVRRTLPEFKSAKRVLILNDEAHHCHRPVEDVEVQEKRKQKRSVEEKREEQKATIWIQGIDRISRACGVLRAYDLTATPFTPTGKNQRPEELFSWIISDFGLNDSLESGLVKTPRLAVRDDAIPDKHLYSKFFHLYEHIKKDLNVKGQKALPHLLIQAINLLSGVWDSTREEWRKAWEKEREDCQRMGRRVPVMIPPVMIIISNLMSTARRLESCMTEDQSISGLSISEDLREEVLRIDQEALEKLEAGEEKTSKKNLIKEVREKFNTVGKEGRLGEQVRCVIGVNMLSEGWDARNVKQILGLRAFSSQLLCEQVIGRGLRRVSYDVDENTGLFHAEYVTVFGVPFTFLPLEEKSEEDRVLEKPKVKIESVLEREYLKIEWPNVRQIQYQLSYFLSIEWEKLSPLVLTTEDIPTRVESAELFDGHTKRDTIERVCDDVGERYRFQELRLEICTLLLRRLEEEGSWRGQRIQGIQGLMEIVERFFTEKLELRTSLDEYSRKELIRANYLRVVNYLREFLVIEEYVRRDIVLDCVRPRRSTLDVRSWYTTRQTHPIEKSQMSHLVVDSRWEGEIAYELERDRIEGLVSWVKNDHIGFEIYYYWEGEVYAYYPDFLIKFRGDRYLILEVKGKRFRESREERKCGAARDWVEAVNSDGRFGEWTFEVLDAPSEFWEVMKNFCQKVK